MGANKSKNLPKLDFPIYGSGSFKDFLVLGGGGGYEVKNELHVYRVENNQAISKPLATLETGNQVPTHIAFAKEKEPIFSVCLTENIGIYKLDPSSGKIEQLLSFEADFSPKEACTNVSVFNHDNNLLAVGGDDSVIRVYFLNKKTFAEVKLNMEITSHVDRIIDLDFNFNSSLLISCSVDKACYIHNARSKGQKMQKLTFCDTYVEG